MSTSDDDINGEAFLDLTDKDLSEMGFTKGQRMKVLKIITAVKVNLTHDQQLQEYILLTAVMYNSYEFGKHPIGRKEKNRSILMFRTKLHLDLLKKKRKQKLLVVHQV